MAQQHPALIFFASSLVLLSFAGNSSVQAADRKAEERLCSQDSVYQEVKQHLQNAKEASQANRYESAVKFLNAGEKRLMAYEIENNLSSHHAPDVVVLDDTGLGWAAAFEFEKKGDWAAAAGLKTSTLESQLRLACDEISYKLGYRGGR